MSSAFRAWAPIVALVLVCIVGAFYASRLKNNPHFYAAQIKTVRSALAGESVRLWDLNEIQEALRGDDAFKQALKDADISDEDVQRLMSDEFLYVRFPKRE